MSRRDSVSAALLKRLVKPRVAPNRLSPAPGTMCGQPAAEALPRSPCIPPALPCSVEAAHRRRLTGRIYAGYGGTPLPTPGMHRPPHCPAHFCQRGEVCRLHVSQHGITPRAPLLNRQCIMFCKFHCGWPDIHSSCGLHPTQLLMTQLWHFLRCLPAAQAQPPELAASPRFPAAPHPGLPQAMWTHAVPAAPVLLRGQGGRSWHAAIRREEPAHAGKSRQSACLPCWALWH